MVDQSPVEPRQPYRLPAGPRRSRRRRILIWVGAVFAVLVLAGVVARVLGGNSRTPSPFATFASGGVVYCSEAMADYSFDIRAGTRVDVTFPGSGVFKVSWTNSAGANASQVYRQGANGTGHTFVVAGLAPPFTSEINLSVVSPLGGGDCRLQALVAP